MRVDRFVGRSRDSIVEVEYSSESFELFIIFYGMVLQVLIGYLNYIIIRLQVQIVDEKIYGIRIQNKIYNKGKVN